MAKSRFLIAAALLAALFSTAACGKKGPPELVPGGNYPTSYPTH
ncbi:MAG: lipoprotein [Rhodospirillaceae bacterium]